MKYENLTIRKKELDKHRPLSKELLRNLEDWFRIELTYTSNAIEGNTLTRQETALVVEKGITVGGKSLIEHLEATNHAQALDWVTEQVSKKPNNLSEANVLKIHEIILKSINDENAGRYRNVAVRISGSTVILPNPKKVPQLMEEFAHWLKANKDSHPVEFAAEAHYQLVTIHPFIDGNGRTARLLMNMMLMMYGYPPAIIRKKERLDYIKSLEKAQLGGSKESFYKIIAAAVDRSFDIYLNAVTGKNQTINLDSSVLIKIGELAKEVGEPISTIRHWTKLGLLEVAELTVGGFALYDFDMVSRCKEIQNLKKKRFTLAEIKHNVTKL